METLNKELSVLQQTACNVNRLGQNERKKNTFDHLDWWSGHAWFIKWFYRVGIMFVEWRTIAVFISNLFHIPFFPFDLILYIVLSVRNVKSSTVVKYDRFNKTCFIDGRWKYLVFFPQCWLLLAAVEGTRSFKSAFLLESSHLVAYVPKDNWILQERLWFFLLFKVKLIERN